jgi:hypothetical protein
VPRTGQSRPDNLDRRRLQTARNRQNKDFIRKEDLRFRQETSTYGDADGEINVGGPGIRKKQWREEEPEKKSGFKKLFSSKSRNNSKIDSS